MSEMVDWEGEEAESDREMDRLLAELAALRTVRDAAREYIKFSPSNYSTATAGSRQKHVERKLAFGRLRDVLADAAAFDDGEDA